MVTFSQQNKLLFLPSPLYGLRIGCLLVLAVALMLVDTYTQHPAKWRESLATLVTPVLHLAKWPSELVGWTAHSLATQQQLKADNAALKSKLLLMDAKLQRLLSIEKENSDLRALLQSSKRFTEETLVAQLLAENPSPFVHQISLNQGLIEGVDLGQAVLDAKGVMGQVIATSKHSSDVLLLTDSRSAIPIQNQRNALRAIAVGDGTDDVLWLQHVPKNSDIKVGDLIVTSGLAQRFPAGYPIGEVALVNTSTGDLFANVQVKPAARLRRSRQLLIVRAKTSNGMKS